MTVAILKFLLKCEEKEMYERRIGGLYQEEQKRNSQAILSKSLIQFLIQYSTKM